MNKHNKWYKNSFSPVQHFITDLHLAITSLLVYLESSKNGEMFYNKISTLYE